MKKKYAIVGIGGRSKMFISAILKTYSEIAELVAVCDINPIRRDFVIDSLFEDYNLAELPRYHADDFDKMLADEKPDRLIVTTKDSLHHDYICRGLRAGIDVISEKPMTTDAEKCQQIIDAIKETGRHLTVTFNYRYAPKASKVKELVMNGEIGDVTSVHFEWLLDTRHGADYFRRWHRQKENSGGLLVHKATHHFDLVNWVINSSPKTVFAQGNLAFYGKENAKKRGIEQDYRYYSEDLEKARKDPFSLILEDDKRLKGMYKDAEAADDYHRDQNVFGEGINIEDNMCVNVRYENNALMSYTLVAHCPWEGHRMMINGTRGRIEYTDIQNSYISSSEDDINLAENRGEEEIIRYEVPSILVQRHFEKARAVDFEEAVGGHGGGDVRLLSHVFEGVGEDPLSHAADYQDGAKSILTGIAANQSIATGLPVEVKDLVRF